MDDFTNPCVPVFPIKPKLEPKARDGSSLDAYPVFTPSRCILASRSSQRTIANVASWCLSRTFEQWVSCVALCSDFIALQSMTIVKTTHLLDVIGEDKI